MRLPAWSQDNAASVRREAEPYRQMSREERLRHLAAACRTAARLLRSRPDAERVLRYVDPLPDSSRRALERLRQQR
jgi:hypothetical protein